MLRPLPDKALCSQPRAATAPRRRRSLSRPFAYRPLRFKLLAGAAALRAGALTLATTALATTALITTALTTTGAAAQEATKIRTFAVDVAPTLARLLKEQDGNRDNRITAADGRVPMFQLPTREGDDVLIEGHSALSNLLMILAKAQAAGQGLVAITATDLYRSVPDQLSHLISAEFWLQLTRRLDGQSLEENFADPKICAGWCRRIYVPYADKAALDYYQSIASQRPQLGLEVVRLPATLTPTYVKSLDTKPGILSLAMRPRQDGGVEPIPYVVPGGRFNEMYGWDSYFIAEGLLATGHSTLARDLVDHLTYQIKHYGKVLNANRTYYLTRSQPPLLTSMIRQVYAALPHTPANRRWLVDALNAAITEYRQVWTTGEHLTTTGLSRYYGYGLRLPPEVEVASFREALEPFANRHGLPLVEFARQYDQGSIKEPELDRFFLHDQAMRESGHDTTHRLASNGSDLAPVCLNALLYKYEVDLAALIKDEFGGQLPDVIAAEDAVATAWQQRAEQRRKLMLKLQWNEEAQLFLDYDLQRKRQAPYIAATTLYPLWAGVVSKKDAGRLVAAALAKLESDGGLLASAAESLPAGALSGERRQWDYPYAWAPHQMLVWEGLRRYGFQSEATRLQYRWLHTIVTNAAIYNSAVTEKYDVVGQSLEAPAEYGNVGSHFAFYPRGGFGWTNASFIVGRQQLPADLVGKLNQRIAPEWLFKRPSTIGLRKKDQAK